MWPSLTGSCGLSGLQCIWAITIPVGSTFIAGAEHRLPEFPLTNLCRPIEDTDCLASATMWGSGYLRLYGNPYLLGVDFVVRSCWPTAFCVDDVVFLRLFVFLVSDSLVPA